MRLIISESGRAPSDQKIAGGLLYQPEQTTIRHRYKDGEEVPPALVEVSELSPYENS